ncbi:hypothetical protein C0991_008551 [Blastosporella zonata]|nr:hypothetical protein C0991_008551 [Blastosporella zonata]
MRTTCELSLSNLGVDLPATSDIPPIFSWTLSSSYPETTVQLSYQILVSQRDSQIWNSGTVPGKKPRLITYKGPSLFPDTRYFWTVQIQTTTGSVSASSEFTTGPPIHPGNSLLTIQSRQSDPLATSLTSAQWIWTSEPTDTPPLAPPGDRAFRKTYTPPSGLSATSADILIAVDDRYSLYVSGKLIGASAVSTDNYEWRTSGRYHVSALGAGPVVFAIRGTNLKDVNTGGDSPAGILIAIRVTNSDGSVQTITGDTSWRATANIPTNFQEPAVDDSGWASPILLVGYGSIPWESQVIIPDAADAVSVTMSAASTTTTTSHAPAASISTSTVIVSESSLTITSSKQSPESSSSSTTLTSSSQTTLVGGPTDIETTTATSFLTDPSTTPPSTTPSPPTSDDSSNSTTSSKKASVGPIVGGVIGGVVTLAVLAFTLLCRKRLFRNNDRRDHRRNPSSASEVPSDVREYTELLIEPFPLGSLGRGVPPPAAPEPVGKHQPNNTGIETEYQQDSDIDISMSGGGVITQSAAGGRLQRLQALMAELNREIATCGEGSPYVSELRGRIAELTREHPDEDGRPEVIPPPYAYQ